MRPIDFALSNRFRLYLPDYRQQQVQLSGTGASDIECIAASIPGRQITTLDAPLGTWRQSVKTPNGYFNEDLVLDFRLIDYSLYDYFKTWESKIINDNYRVNYADQYEKDVGIAQLDKRGKTIKEVTLIGAYPTTINNIELSMDSSDTIATMNVTLTYIDIR